MRTDALQLVVGGERAPARASDSTRDVRDLPREMRVHGGHAACCIERAMSASADFSLEIVVTAPVVDEQARTTPFTKVSALPAIDRRPLPGVDLRPAQQRAAEAARMPVVREPTPLPLPPPRHSWIPSAKNPVPSRTKARSLLGVPPPPAPRAVPLSDEDEARMARRVRGYKKIAWAQAMLEKLFTEQP